MNNQQFHNPNLIVLPADPPPIAPLQPDGETSGTDHGSSVTPVNAKVVREWLESTDTSILYLGKPVHTVVSTVFSNRVSFVGWIVSVQKETSVVYSLRDESGTVLARQYAVDPNDPVGVIGSGYVQVVGNLFANAGCFSINVHRIFPVSSFNSILHHTMKVIQTFLTFRRHLDATLENVVIQALQMLQQDTPQGVHLEPLLAVLREYGITEDQVRSSLLRMANEKKVSVVDEDTFVSNFTF